MKSKLYQDSFKGTTVESIMKIFHEAKNGKVKLPRNAFMSDEKSQTFSKRIRLTYDPAKPHSSLEFNMIQNWFLDSLTFALNQWMGKYVAYGRGCEVKNIVYWRENPMPSTKDGVKVIFTVNAVIPIEGRFIQEKCAVSDCENTDLRITMDDGQVINEPCAMGNFQVCQSCYQGLDGRNRLNDVDRSLTPMEKYFIKLPVQIRGRMVDYEAESKGKPIHKQQVRSLNMSLISYGVVNHRDVVFGLAGGSLNA